MITQLVDPDTGQPRPIRGVDGNIVLSLPPDGSAITPDDGVIYDPPIMVWVGDAASLLVTVMPYGLGGDLLVQYPTKLGMTIPVLARRLMASGTTATILRGQPVYKVPAPIGPTADTTLITADSTVITADSF